jgi:hypothetical protein
MVILFVKWLSKLTLPECHLTFNSFETHPSHKMIIRHHTHLATLWFPETAIGAVIFAVYSMLSAQPGYYFLTNGIVRLDLFPLLWLFNGLLQWLVLRKMITHSSNWIWITILSSFGFLVIFLPLAYIAIVTIMGITDGGDYNHMLEPYVHDTTEMSNFLDYYFALFVLPVPVVVSALIRGLFIKNRLKTSAQKMDLNRVVQGPKNDQPPIVPG